MRDILQWTAERLDGHFDASAGVCGASGWPGRRAVATLVPCRPVVADWGAALRGTVQITGDILAPPLSAEEWEGGAG